MNRRAIPRVFFVVLALLALMACRPPANPGNVPADLEEAVQNTFENLPVLKMKLPGSLSMNEDASSRALGDTTELDAETLPGLKSQAWYNLQGSSGNMVLPYVNAAFDFLRDYADDNEIPVGEIFEVPFTTEDLAVMFGVDAAEVPPGYEVSASFRVDGETKEEFSIYSNIVIDISYEGFVAAIGVKSRVDVVYEGAEQKLKMFFTVGITQSDGENNVVMVVPMYATYDSATGACVTAMKLEQTVNDVPEEGTFGTVQKSLVDSQGAVSIVNASFNDGVPDHLHVAYGNDSVGGIASQSSYTCYYVDSNGDTQSANRNSYWSEYYDGNGDIIRRDNGSSQLQVPVHGENAFTNLADDIRFGSAPETYSTRSHNAQVGGTNYWISERKDGAGKWFEYLRSSYSVDGDVSYTTYLTGSDWVDDYRWYWDNTSKVCGYQDTTDGGETWTDVSVYPGAAQNDFVYKADPGKWTAGDVVYSVDSTQIVEEGETTYFETDYYQGFVVPAPESRGGQDFWFTYEYPLKQLLPLSAGYRDDYTVIQEEGATSTGTWIGLDGENHTWSSTNYTYYLNKNERDIDGDGDNDEETTRRFDDDFDILLDKISSYEMYFWNPDIGDVTKTRAYFWVTTGTLPAFFSDPSGVANSVSNTLNNLMDTAASQGATEYDEELEAAKTATQGVF